MIKQNFKIKGNRVEEKSFVLKMKGGEKNVSFSFIDH